MPTIHDEITKFIKKEYPMLEHKQIRANINFTIFVIKSLLKENKKIMVPNFGTFEIKKQKRTKFRNPKTGEQMTKEESIKIKFNSSKNFIKEILHDCEW